MKIITSIGLFFFWILVYPFFSAQGDEIVVEKFAFPGSKNLFPPEWKSKQKNTTIYTIQEEEGNCFLRAKADKQSVSIGKKVKYKLKDYPYLSWRWRANKLPENGNERVKAFSDSAAGIYVVFSGYPVPKTIKYVWSTTLPVGSCIESPYTGRTKIVVLRSGAQDLEKWISETVNVAEDYKRLFKSKPGEVKGIGILSDSDMTESSAWADYDDIIAFAKPASAFSD